MATRQEVQARRSAMLRALRERCRSGELRAGDLAPSKRQLAAEFEVSPTIVGQVLEEQIGEGLFYTIARSGTYVGTPRPLVRPCFAFLCGEEASPVRQGFEDRVARLGGSVLALSLAQTQACCESKAFPAAAGVVEWGSRLSLDEWRELLGSVPALACYATLEDEAESRDSVAFDDVDGGRQATEHLLHGGHRAIAFLGLHQEAAAHARDGDRPEWSRLRAAGWKAALEEAGLAHEGLLFLADRSTGSHSHPEHVEAARDGARKIARRADIEAVVAANDRAAQALLEELRAAGVPPSRWPAVVSFDADIALQSETLTSLRLPWEEIGSTMADLLWQRSHGELSLEPQHRLVRMRLIPRLTCRPRWRSGESGAALLDATLAPIPLAPA